MEIELAAAVTALRDELVRAAVQGAGHGIGFTVGSIELEFTVELRVDAKAKAGFKAWVLSADVEAGATRGRTHKVKLAVTPVLPNGADLVIAGDQRRSVGPGVDEDDDLQR